MVPTHKSVLALDVSCTAQSLNERYGILIPESMRKPNSPAPHPDTDIDSTPRLRSVIYMVDHMCETDMPKSVRILRLKSRVTRWEQSSANLTATVTCPTSSR